MRSYVLENIINSCDFWLHAECCGQLLEIRKKFIGSQLG